MKQNLIVGGVAVVLAVLLSAVLIKPVQNVTSQVLGSASSPSVLDGCMDVNGVNVCYRAAKTGSASTTPCTLRSPSFATSTLVTASFQISSTSASALLIQLGRDSTAYSTTTALASVTIAANTPATIVASTTPTTETTTFSPGQYLVVKTANTQVGGTCKGVFVVN